MRRFVFYITLLCAGVLHAPTGPLYGQTAYDDSLPVSNAYECRLFHYGEVLSLVQQLAATAGPLARQVEAPLEELVANGLQACRIGRRLPAQVKALHNYLHSEALFTYRPASTVVDIFARRQYACITSTALYAAILERAGVSYAIVRQPEHVFIVAWERRDTLLIETTDPLQGYDFPLSATAYTDYASILELPQLSFSELMGCQYYNQGVVAMYAGQTEEARVYFQKAYQLYKAPILRQLLDIQPKASLEPSPWMSMGEVNEE